MGDGATTDGRCNCEASQSSTRAVIGDGDGGDDAGARARKRDVEREGVRSRRDAERARADDAAAADRYVHARGRL